MAPNLRGHLILMTGEAYNSNITAGQPYIKFEMYGQSMNALMSRAENLLASGEVSRGDVVRMLGEVAGGLINQEYEELVLNFYLVKKPKRGSRLNGKEKRHKVGITMRVKNLDEIDVDALSKMAVAKLGMIVP